MNKDETMLCLKRSLRLLSDKAYVKLYFRMWFKGMLNLQNPQTLNEKLQRMKFNYRFPLQTVVSDKYAMRKYVADKIGEEYLILLLGEWKGFDDIDFDKFPNQFVLKCNHDSGGLEICEDKHKFNKEETRQKINKSSLKSNFYDVGREYQNRNIVSRIIFEKCISEDGSITKDYKIYCLNGKTDAILVCTDRFSKHSHKAKYYFFGKEWNFLRYNYGDDKISTSNIPKPENLTQMLAIAEMLSQNFISTRIDFYNSNGKIYFGGIRERPDENKIIGVCNCILLFCRKFAGFKT